MTKTTHPFVRDALKYLPAKTPIALKNFVKVLYAKTPEEDLEQMTPKELSEAARIHWALSGEMTENRPAIRIHTTQSESVSSGCTHIDIVQKDTSFLIDSIVAEIVRQKHHIQILLHPILHIKNKGKKKTRDAASLSFSIQPEKDTAARSHIHIKLRDALSAAQCEELEMGIRRVIEDVNYATRDWQDMQKMLRRARDEVGRFPSHYGKSLIAEYQAFMDYLYNHNFTLLGYREYKFKETDGKVTSSVIKGSSLGLLHDDVKPVYVSGARQSLTQTQQNMRRNQLPLTITKINKRSTVHRRVPLDAIAVKTFDKKGNVTGELLFIGLFTSVTYSRSVEDIPFLRMKVENVVKRSAFLPGSHNEKALRHILEKYPRDEVLQIPEDRLCRHVMSILGLQERPRIALYTRPDPFGRYISCLIYVPREKYETRLRLKLQHILEEELGGHCTNYEVTQDDSPLARATFLIDINHLPAIPKYSAAQIETRLEDAGRLWSEKLRKALEEASEEEKVIAGFTQKYGTAFPDSYQNRYTLAQAVYDIGKIEASLSENKIELDLYCPENICEPGRMRLKFYNPGAPVPLSDILPILENMGLRSISELPFEIKPAHIDRSVWIHDFMLEAEDDKSFKGVFHIKNVFEKALTKIWDGSMENDGLNRLVVGAQMDWRDITILRAYIRYMQQMRIPFSCPYIENALSKNPHIAQEIVHLFKALFDPANGKKAQTLAAATNTKITKALEAVESLDQDRILRWMSGLVNVTLRTNFFQTDEGKQPKSYLSFKLESGKIEHLPQPKPYREIFVYSPRMEGIHLRGDKIARGGIRWSDRHEDFRTEILGLMKAQQVKNSVIVPMGAKGGFVVKNPPKKGGRQAFIEEGIECYKILIRGLLDITDNRTGNKIIPPENVVRRDEDDPYLVVAADKGTATFSDIANGLSEEYGFWLGDGFASGGSAGYDHKKMGITARGAWESVKRHFRELNHDTQTQDFNIVGVGDMGGDVFGNGMILSEHIRLIGSFNHLHIFCDPNPDPAASFKERVRLFNAVKGWDEYDTKKLSQGGRIYSRSDKSLKLTPEIRKSFDLESDDVTPNALIRAMLKSRTDLLWFGGIGTYIKASRETNEEVGDKANDAIRLNAKDIRAKVIGEGANLGMTQQARIEYSQNGGRLNADYIDNSAGVDCSDHEVNIKILTGEIMRMPRYKMNIKTRNKMLESMTDEVGALVLRNNYQQAQGISLMELQAAANLPEHAQLMRELEKSGSLKRVLENLPPDEEIEERIRTGKGLTRPELSILQAYAKISYTSELLDSDIPESKAMEGRLLKYFPQHMSKTYKKEALSHMLKREIICTTLANSIVNRMGPTFMMKRIEKSGTDAAEVAKAYIIVREAFGLRHIWNEIEALDNKVPALVQLKAFQNIAQMTDRAVTWFLTRTGCNLNINKEIAAYETGIDEVRRNLDKVATKTLSKNIENLAALNINNGMPKDLAHHIALMPMLSSACDIIRISEKRKVDTAITAQVYFELGEHFHLDWMRQKAHYLPTGDRWSTEALEGLIDQLYSCQAGLASRILKDTIKAAGTTKFKLNGKERILKKWIETHGQQARLLEPLFDELRSSAAVDLPMLIIAEQRLRGLYGG